MRLYRFVGWISPAGIALCISAVAAELQMKTQAAKSVTVDDDSFQGANNVHVTFIYNITMYAILIILLVDLHTSTFMLDCTKALNQFGYLKVIARSCLFAAVEACVLIAIRFIAIRWYVHRLLPSGLTPEDKPLRFWQMIDPTPNRPTDSAYWVPRGGGREVDEDDYNYIPE